MESIHAIDYRRRLELFETACKVFAVPKDVRHEWIRIRFFSWFRADVLIVNGDEESYEKASERISTVPGRYRARGNQETLANSS